MIGITLKASEKGALLIVRLSGKLQKAQFEPFRAQFESEIRHHQELRLCFIVDDQLRWDPRSKWPSLVFNSRHRTSISKLAIAGGGTTWQRWLQMACRPLLIQRARCFDSDQREYAMDWITTELY